MKSQVLPGYAVSVSDFSHGETHGESIEIFIDKKDDVHYPAKNHSTLAASYEALYQESEALKAAGILKQLHHYPECYEKYDAELERLVGEHIIEGVQRACHDVSFMKKDKCSQTGNYK